MFDKQSLAFRLTLSITLLVILVVMGITLLSIQREQQTFQNELQQQAVVLLDTLIAIEADALYRLDAVTLKNLTSSLGKAQVVTFARVYDATGRIVADAFDEQAVFQTDADPAGQNLLNVDMTQYEWQKDQLIAGKAVTAGRQRLGAIAIGLSTLPLQTKMNAVRDQGIIVALLAAGAGGLISLLLSRSIIAPLQKLTQATERITGGDLSHRINSSGGRELTLLSDTFNRMSSQLQENIQKLENQAAELRQTNDSLRHEITERQRVEEEREKLIGELSIATEKALESSRLKSEFLAVMSHELRTPLNAIIGLSGILIEGMAGELDVEAHGMVKGIYESSINLLELINNILDLSKIEAGRMELMYDEEAVSVLVERWQAQMQVLAAKKGLDFKIEVDPNTPPIIECDAERLSQIVVNLLSNAIKFTGQGSVRLHISQQNESLVFVVQDTGIGIPPHALNYIFDEFRQVDSSSRRNHGGTGLGLSIVRRLIIAMGGTVRVTSQVDSGSVFTVTLPLERVRV